MAVVLIGWVAAAAGRAVAGSGSDDDDDDRKEIRKVRVYRTSDDEQRPYLGVQVEEEVDLESGGARIEHVVPDSPADQAGLKDGDVIVEVDGRTVRGPRALTDSLGKKEPGDKVKLGVVRDGDRETITAELGERPRVFAWSGGDWGFRARRPLLGVELVATTPELREHLGGDRDRGVLVGKVVDDSAAEKAGIQVGDLIVGVEGATIEDVGDLMESLHDHVGETVRIDVVRDGHATEVRAKLPDPDEDDAEGASMRSRRAPRAYTGAIRSANTAQREAYRAALADARAAYREAVSGARRGEVTLY